MIFGKRNSKEKRNYRINEYLKTISITAMFLLYIMVMVSRQYDDNSLRAANGICLPSPTKNVVGASLMGAKRNTHIKKKIKKKNKKRKRVVSCRSIEKSRNIKLYFTETDKINLAKVMYRESRGQLSKTEQACVGWVVCNRVDKEKKVTITQILKRPYQFAYIYDTPVIPRLYNLANDVLTRWSMEKNGEKNVGRVLPKSYCWFNGDGKHNYFRNKFDGNYKIWDYSLKSPYKT